ncbi:uncharacterized protein LOC110887627 [Helianthus annuus]|uniref:uncharacterized protein LOC110887627 n=1 Tax=Helianthus annuus TaxID=4232 RepID=UPI000B8F64B4|nr:uncharacterized protein LOC110887627 [Helianthus annuus]
MGRAKAVGPDNVSIEVWKCLGDKVVQWLTTLFNLIFKSGKMPDRWRSIIVVPLYKNKGDVQCCGNYKEIKMLRIAILYGTKCWAIKKTQAHKMEVAEMRMLRWMCGHTRLDRIRNEVCRERLGVTNISDKITEDRLRWFWHVKRRQSTAPVRAVEILTVEGMRRRGSPN